MARLIGDWLLKTDDTAADAALIACHICDALLTEPPADVFRARCPRCGHVLNTERRDGHDIVLAIAITAAALVLSSLSLPLLSLEAGGKENIASLFDAANAMRGEGQLLALSIASLIVAVPLARALALIWILAPLRLGYGPAPLARPLFRMCIELRQWAMAEVFIIGIIVALVKLLSYATIGLGAAFWLLFLLSLAMIAEDIFLCKRSVWRRLA